jgi:hypothetical protein
LSLLITSGQGIHRERHDNALQEACRRRAAGLAKGVQQSGEQDPLDRRAGDCEFQDVADYDTDYRRPIETFEETITAAMSLEFYRMA